jgi:hypothetical protein
MGEPDLGQRISVTAPLGAVSVLVGTNTSGCERSFIG